MTTQRSAKMVLSSLIGCARVLGMGSGCSAHENKPFMCAGQGCGKGQDHCCAETDAECDEHGGLRICPVVTTTEAAGDGDRDEPIESAAMLAHPPDCVLALGMSLLATVAQQK